MKIIFFFFCFLEMHEKEKDLNIIVHQMYACFSLTATVLINLSKTFSLTCRSTTMHSERGRERERDLRQSMWFPYPTNRKQELKKKLSPPNAKLLQTSITRRAPAICLCAHGWSISRREGIRSISSSNDASSAFFLLLLKVLTEDCLVISWSIYI